MGENLQNLSKSEGFNPNTIATSLIKDLFKLDEIGQ